MLTDGLDITKGMSIDFWKQQTGSFAAIIENDDLLVSFVDPIKGYPLYYYKDQSFSISDSARMLKNQFYLKKVNDTSLLEYITAGYVTGRETIYHDIFQIQAGEIIRLDKKLMMLSRERYYCYLPTEKMNGNIQDYSFQLNGVIDKAFNRVKEFANGRPIWIPLSGGLDSRLNVCKLVEMGYSNIHTFSYGCKISKNYDARAAKEIAKILNVPWTFIPPNKKRSRQFFRSTLRKQYWDFSDNFAARPNTQDIEYLYYLRKINDIPEDAIIVNGQTGDFITGGHIPSNIMGDRLTSEDLLQIIINKHFSVWSSISYDVLRSKLRDKILELLNITHMQNLTLGELCSLYECWEWQERQAKTITAGQRAYDFLDFKWCLPHWDFEYLYFWSSVPLNLRKNQLLYRYYLNNYNYKGLFQNFQTNPNSGYNIKNNLLRILSLFNIDKNPLVKYTSYFGFYSYRYAYFPVKFYFEIIKQANVPPEARGLIALYISTWLEENNFLDIKSLITKINSEYNI